MAHPLAFSAFLRDIGAPVDAYFQRQGLPALCRDPNLFVTLKKAWALFDDVSRREDRMAGWHVGRFVGDNNLGSGLLKQLDRAPTLLQALRNLVRMVSTEASHLRIGILERYGHILFYTHYAGMSHETGYSVSQAYQLEVYVDLVRHFTGTCWNRIGRSMRLAGLSDSGARRISPGCFGVSAGSLPFNSDGSGCTHLISVAATGKSAGLISISPISMVSKVFVFCCQRF